MDLIENQKIISIDDINSRNITMLEKFELASVIKSIPNLWKEHVYDYNHIDYVSFNVQQIRDIEIKMKSRPVYENIIKKITASPASENFFLKETSI